MRNRVKTQHRRFVYLMCSSTFTFHRYVVLPVFEFFSGKGGYAAVEVRVTVLKDLRTSTFGSTLLS